MSKTLADLSEFGMIHQITRDLVMPPAVSVGPGDDAAVFLVNGSAVVSTDIMIENQHFRLDWSSGADIGHKVVAVNVADLEAMGATPVGIVIAFSAPATTEVSWVREFATGVREECKKANIALIGGDVTASGEITAAATVIGESAGRVPVTRAGAEVGNQVALCGRLGWAAAGLAVLGRGFRSPRAVVDAHRMPEVPYGQGAVAADSGATSMIDVSDGLLADLGHIAEASKVSFNIDSTAFPIAETIRAVGAATGISPLTFILTGGEDHALVATFPESVELPEGWNRIGTVLPVTDQGPQVLVDGQFWEGETGWQHFRS